MNNILVVEDEIPISNVICKYLKVAGYDTETAYNGQEALHKIETDKFDLVLLDVMIPYLNGFDLIKILKPKNISVIFLTAKDELTDKLQGFRLGADDYITKPFEYQELLARIRAVLNRNNKLTNKIVYGDVEINLDSHEVIKNGKQIELLPKEYELLILFIKNRHIALTREVLMQKVWGYDFMGETRTIDAHVQRIRKKLGWKNEIKTIFKTGYRLE
ncbi:alkaline phosphatase synthesis transcriptional regulatory protein PhoP [Clostridium pasteurianum DSM 525 = ATCC 6013]|uniref:Stage 0 sporulation protein A homolog n=1 Tax=Clostridium pasteurianum DSM 525 = ATCC 6013 TaxID=1262449 RepID=A0A0H3JAH5_CLOPA|nr:response regulator transcription factor [Clostridium pasteurianum]AJA48565.1 alkaline phosphatase synthesis transcriptional regulatory protein PhoP [Clostridium pasteurianum DSM 525 = ATCC 6013]AJA52553.1 alkaline phosphatase synthesis transcriptional regulatory protein PhoP [Clostridium pasteurianum DSM 525 = ATCC 6013]AOZ75797.1 two-component system response regulator [Clostridium pasteurianum DSM 525 = ATCC 6013]AOZ79593.1 two-component system response regulator [Clostridium pasteurianum]